MEEGCCKIQQKFIGPPPPPSILYWMHKNTEIIRAIVSITRPMLTVTMDGMSPCDAAKRREKKHNNEPKKGGRVREYSIKDLNFWLEKHTPGK